MFGSRKSKEPSPSLVSGVMDDLHDLQFDDETEFGRGLVILLTEYPTSTAAEAIVGAIIEKHPRYAYIYAKDIVKGRWERGEKAIMRSPEWAYNYAINIIGGRWRPGEAAILKSGHFSYLYASDVLGGRWKEAEKSKALIMNSFAAAKYAEHVMNERWMEAEPYIKKNPDAWYWYTRKFKMRPLDRE